MAAQNGTFEAIAIGASAGGVNALTSLVSALPGGLPVPVFVVLHLHPSHPSALASLMGRRAQLPVEDAVDGARVVAGHVYVAPPDTHLLVANGRLTLASSAPVHFVRPSVDLLFQSVAEAYGERAIGVVLTGTGSDGAVGIRAIKGRGGTTIVQDPEEAAHPGMPLAACATGCVDWKLALAEIAPKLADLVIAGHDRSRTAGTWATT